MLHNSLLSRRQDSHLRKLIDKNIKKICDNLKYTYFNFLNREICSHAYLYDYYKQGETVTLALFNGDKINLGAIRVSISTLYIEERSNLTQDQLNAKSRENLEENAI